MRDAPLRATTDYGTLQGVDYRAVLLDDGTVNLLSTAATCPDGFTAGSTPGRWHRYTRPDELSALAHVTVQAQWRDHPVTVLGDPIQGQVVVSYAGPDHTWADRELPKSEPLLWQGSIPVDDISHVREDRQDRLPWASDRYRASHP